MKGVHNMIECEKCGVSFSRDEDMKRHLETVSHAHAAAAVKARKSKDVDGRSKYQDGSKDQDGRSKDQNASSKDVHGRSMDQHGRFKDQVDRSKDQDSRSKAQDVRSNNVDDRSKDQHGRSSSVGLNKKRKGKADILDKTLFGALPPPIGSKRQWWEGCSYRCNHCKERFTDVRDASSHVRSRHRREARDNLMANNYSARR